MSETYCRRLTFSTLVIQFYCMLGATYPLPDLGTSCIGVLQHGQVYDYGVLMGNILIQTTEHILTQLKNPRKTWGKASIRSFAKWGTSHWPSTRRARSASTLLRST
ncbi:unnamed protein product [Allacma fusca]|uniref:Uncharacterized protein n=1 Tax=Allacma fusca TaxID=39272 RepID=A0A8J2LP89_9HEXA|nr:unnamed protein product [Allacma fusca]